MLPPLASVPGIVQRVVQWTPLPYPIHFPAALLLSLLVDVAPCLLAIWSWSAIFFPRNCWLWRPELRHYFVMAG